MSKTTRKTPRKAKRPRAPADTTDAGGFTMDDDIDSDVPDYEAERATGNAIVVQCAKELLRLIPPDLSLPADDFDELQSCLSAALARVKAIRTGAIFTSANVPKEPPAPTEEQARKLKETWVPPTPEQLAEAARFDAGPTRRDRADLRRMRGQRDAAVAKIQALDASIKKLELFKARGTDRNLEMEDLDCEVRALAQRGEKPKIISAAVSLLYPGLPERAKSEKAINARLYRARAAGFQQPVSPTAKRPRAKG